jgi:hypothetical protein
MNYFGEISSPLSSDLCGLCVFAGDNPSFGCGCDSFACLNFCLHSTSVFGELLFGSASPTPARGSVASYVRRLTSDEGPSLASLKQLLRVEQSKQSENLRKQRKLSSITDQKDFFCTFDSFLVCATSRTPTRPISSINSSCRGLRLRRPSPPRSATVTWPTREYDAGQGHRKKPPCRPSPVYSRGRR